MNDMRKILAAASYAADKHRNQKRKGSDAQPYINHPLQVAGLVANVGEVEDVEIIVAALLHDTVEDCGVTLDELENLFGPAVAGYVGEVTDDKSLPKDERKRLQIEHAPHLSHGAKQIKLADKISNIQDVTENPPHDWSPSRRREYVEWGENVVAGLRGSNAKLESMFDDVVRSARVKLT